MTHSAFFFEGQTRREPQSLAEAALNATGIKG